MWFKDGASKYTEVFLRGFYDYAGEEDLRED